MTVYLFMHNAVRQEKVARFLVNVLNALVIGHMEIREQDTYFPLFCFLSC